MPQFNAKVPDPLGKDEPELLAPGGVRAPAVWRLFFVLICQYRLESAAMQVQSDHISRRERFSWQGGVKQLIDHLATRGTNGSLGLSRLMRGDDDPCAWTGW